MNNINIPITEVVIMEDRARIKRTMKIKFPPGQSRYCLSGVSPVLVDKTLHISFPDQNKIQLLESRMLRDYKVQNKSLSDDYASLERDIQSIFNDIQESTGKIESLRHEITLLQQTLDLSLYELPIDIRRGTIPGDDYEKELSLIQKNIIEKESLIIKTERNLSDLNQKRDDKTILLNTIGTPSTFLDCSIVFEVLTKEAVESEICLDYLVPNVLWRPSYKADLRGDKLLFESQGCIWQNTGEDWNNVNISLSTQRASLGVEPPTLGDDFILLEKKAKEQIVEFREENISNSGLGQSESGSTNLPGIDDGGDVLFIHGLNKITVPSNGRPYKVITGNFESTVEIDLIGIPEMSPYVFIRSLQVNTSSYPILAGPVDLVRNNCFLGKTSLFYISPGEKYHLPWGPDTELRLQRLHHEERKKKALGSWEEITYNTTLSLSNMGSNKKSIKLMERIPHSEVESVKVVLDDRGLGAILDKPDERGIFYRELILDSYDHEKIEYSYILKKAAKVSGV